MRALLHDAASVHDHDPIGLAHGGKAMRSSASMPEARTAHFISNVEVLVIGDGTIDLRYNWHTLSHRYQHTAQFFGTTYLTLDVSGENPKILKKKIILKDDYIHQVIDIYHI